MTRYATMRDAVKADIGRAIRIASVACAAFAVEEYIATLVSYSGSTPLVVKLRLVGVVASLAALWWIPALSVTTSAILWPRFARRLLGGDGLGRGALAFPLPTDRPRPGPARLWAAVGVGLVSAAALQRYGVHVADNHKEKQLSAAMVAIVAALAVPAVVVAYRGATRLLDWLAAEIDPVLGVWSPIGRWRAAAIALGTVISGGIIAAWIAWPAGKSAWSTIPLDHYSEFPPWRTLLPIAAVLGGGALGSWWESHPVFRRLTRTEAVAAAAVAAIVIPLSLFWWGADPETKYVAVTASPALAREVDAIRWANDLDGDGFGSLLGENDCAPFDRRIHPGVVDIPDNGIDENCDGRDFSVHDLARPPGTKAPVPIAFRRPWNVLLITIDATRYDHTTFGGYREGPKHRDTTPELAKLVNRAVSFTFTNAPSAGTMASMPAIMTSKFFHSGIALDENVKPHTPPKIKPENVLIGEIMKSGGYTTGAITSHEYFNESWGLNQGIDSYDNELGKDGDPYKITSAALTDKGVAWISRQHGNKWFLWMHYIDPHGRYVAHPDGVSYGTSEEDLYDGEISYTDHHIGRLLDELARLPGGDHTIVIVTSDHGDGFNEHGFINHGQALYRELLHVPMIFAIPNNPPRKVGGAVSNLDILPTVADLCGIDVSKYSFEGESLVNQIFYGKEDPDRIVFSETNFPEPQRAAVSAKQKLIYRLKGNQYELYDLVHDPWEKTNIWPRDPGAGAVLHDAMDRWLERVLYSRDPVFNQAAAKISDALVKTPPTPGSPTQGVSLDGGNLSVLGVDYAEPTKPVKPGDTTFIYVYFQAAAVPTKSYRFQVIVASASRASFTPDAAMTATIRTPLRTTLDGLFGTERWHKGEIVRDKFEVRVPATWTGDAMALSLVVDVEGEGKKLVLEGPHPGGDTAAVSLGMLPLAPPAALPPPPVPVPQVPPPVRAVPASPGGGSGVGSQAAARP